MLVDIHTNLLWYPDHYSEEFVEFSWAAKKAKMRLTPDVHCAVDDAGWKHNFDSRPEQLVEATRACDKVVVFAIQAPFTGIRGSQEAVAEALGVPRASVSAMESGRRKVSSLELRDLARLYKRPLDWFYDSDAEPIAEDETVSALFRATRNLNQEDKKQVLRFAEFLKGAGQAPPRRRNQ